MKFRLSAFLLAFPLLMSQAMSSMAGSDEQFLAARDAARAGDRNKLERLAPDLQGYELEVYVDYWRLLAEHRVRLSRHFLLYPNPWPKIGHLSRRWHGHAVFPVLPVLGGIIECRSNWQIYVEEFAFALGRVLGREVPWASFIADEPVSPFERKYRDSGQALYRCVVDLDEQ